MASKRTTTRSRSSTQARSARGKRAKAGGRKPAGVLAMLQDDHRRVKSLFQKLERAKSDSEQRSQLAEQACRELRIHAALEEELFYPAIRDQIRDEELVDQAEVEHQSARQLIEQLEQLDPQDPRHAATCRVLAEYVQHHVQEEEKQIFPQVKRAKMDLDAMAEQMQTRRQELLGSAGMGPEEGAGAEQGMERMGRTTTRYRDVARH